MEFSFIFAYKDSARLLVIRSWAHKILTMLVFQQESLLCPISCLSIWQSDVHLASIKVMQRHHPSWRTIRSHQATIVDMAVICIFIAMPAAAGNDLDQVLDHTANGTAWQDGMPCRGKCLNAIASYEQGGQCLDIQINMTRQLALFLQE